MFNTIKSKISIITFLILTALILVLSCYAVIFLKNSKALLIDNYSYSIAVFAQNINKDVIRLESNSKDLALLGKLFYKAGKDAVIARRAVTSIFENYEDSLGGGIWFEPYVVDKNTKRFCIYTYRNKNGNLVVDDSFNNEEYNYTEQKWYKEITKKITPQKNTAWSSPYYEKQGSDTLMITVGTGIFDNGKLIGLSTVDWEISSIIKSIKNIRPTENSFSLFANRKNDYIIVSTDPYLDNENLIDKSLKNIPWYNDDLKKIIYFKYNNKTFIPYVKTLDNDMILIVVIPKDELFYDLVIHFYFLFGILILLSLLISALLYALLMNNIMKPIDKLINIAKRISKGETDVHIKIDKPEEFSQLASTFDKMTEDIKHITKDKALIASELTIARNIQVSSLPSSFFPENKEFDIYASMTPARDVGGDFYDFYFMDDENFMLLIADVSGKGIPAALFMMTAQTLINNMSQSKLEYHRMIEVINSKLCEHNSQNLFVTMFSAIINIKTGKVTYLNCGHNQPLLKDASGSYKYMNLEPNIVLGAFADAKFTLSESILAPGDTIFAYTDGITEALNKNGDMYGDERLMNVVNKFDNADVKSIAENVKKDVINFMDSKNQSDDLTLLVFRYKNQKKYIFKDFAVLENYKSFYTWLQNICNVWGLSEESTNKLDMCCEEIFANVAFYSYPSKTGMIEITINKENNDIIIEFVDEGIQYNPLEKPDPDLSIPPEEKPLGGLGIYMVKELTDEISYEYKDSKNILKVKFLNIFNIN